jgi:hypothetical protein
MKSLLVLGTQKALWHNNLARIVPRKRGVQEWILQVFRHKRPEDAGCVLISDNTLPECEIGQFGEKLNTKRTPISLF